jgi:hypothetical protein
MRFAFLRMNALSLDPGDEERRGKIEALPSEFGQELLALGLTGIHFNHGRAHGGGTERDTLRLGARALGAAAALPDVSAPADVLFDRTQNGEGWRSHSMNEMHVVMVGDASGPDGRGDGNLRRASGSGQGLWWKPARYV